MADTRDTGDTEQMTMVRLAPSLRAKTSDELQHKDKGKAITIDGLDWA